MNYNKTLTFFTWCYTYIIAKKANIKSIAITPKTSIKYEEVSLYPKLKQVIINNKEIAELKMTYTISINPQSQNSLSHLVDSSCYLDPDDGWYPIIHSQNNKLLKYNLEVTTPNFYHVVSEGKKIKELISENTKQTFIESKQSVDSIHLIASNFYVRTIKQDNIDISTYFLSDDKQLSDTYLNYARDYIAQYNKLIAPYPFPKLDIVESPYQVGYAMPSFTVIGNRVLRLPFIVKTSLGHEILHNWWGNSVFVDYSKGNWCEALTTYLADYRFKEQESSKSAMRYRRNIVKNYSHYVTKENDFPLSLFKSRYNRASSSIGYGKGMMVFHQLRLLLGDKQFFSEIKRLYQNYKNNIMSWKEIEIHFSKHSNQNLKPFFKEWIRKKGAPFLKILDYKYDLKKKVLQIKISQKPNHFIMKLPILIINDSEAITKYTTINEDEQVLTIPLEVKPKSFHIDPYFDMFRIPDPKEIPLTFSNFFSQKRPVKFVYKANQINKNLAESLYDLKANKAKKIPKIIKIMSQYKPNIKYLSKINNIITINEDSILINGIKYLNKDLTLVFVYQTNKSDICQFSIYCPDKKLPSRLSKRLPHYQNDSYLLFKGDKVISRGEFETDTNPYFFQLN